MANKIRTVFQPGKVIEVSDNELLDLQRQKAVLEVVTEKDPEKESDEESTSETDTSARSSTPKKK